MQAMTTFNPAAVLGASVPYVFFDKLRDDALAHITRDSRRTGKMSGRIFTRDLNTGLRIQALPALADDVRIQEWDPSRQLYLTSVSYETLELVFGEMYRAGVQLPDPLLCAQAQVACAGRAPADFQAAYDQYVRDADLLLMRIESLRLPVFIKCKGPRTVAAPRRARSLTAGAKGVHITPDLYNARYVRVWLAGLDEVTGYMLRDMAYDHYESQGLRVQVFHI